MPGKNIYKEYVADSYYHVYNRGVAGHIVFKDNGDYIFFQSLLKRYLSSQPAKNTAGITYPSLAGKVEVLAFCLMPTHFHLLLYQKNDDGMRSLLKSVSVAYGMYFNRKYRRRGPVFQQRYRASRITDDAYLLHISRYIHLNPDDYKSWEWSSLPYYAGKYHAEWVKPNRILGLFEDIDYLKFTSDYKSYRDDLKAMPHEFANYPA